VSRALIILDKPSERQRAARWCATAAKGTRVTFQEAKRTTDQNARMWAMLTEVARQVEWHGIKLSADDWKLIVLDALKREKRMAPNLDGTGFVNLGRSSSDLSKTEFSDLFLIIEAFGAREGVTFDQSEAA
jgi:hypothetical protein